LERNVLLTVLSRIGQNSRCFEGLETAVRTSRMKICRRPVPEWRRRSAHTIADRGLRSLPWRG
ncbi:hypothetical protein, partial [Actinoplanes xinjiangensis]|uniref:hypothetical protein n=1 Tax=Actinoplanes xinjiangensis TaxID=512350 RepID=UPI003429AAEC